MNNRDPLPTGPLRDDELQQFRRLMRFLVKNEDRLTTLMTVADNWERWGWAKRALFRAAVAITTIWGAIAAYRSAIEHFWKGQ